MRTSCLEWRHLNRSKIAAEAAFGVAITFTLIPVLTPMPPFDDSVNGKSVGVRENQVFSGGDL
jgi:hypothetical protein